MSDIGDAIEDARTEIGLAAGEFLPDLCNLIEIGLVSDGHHGKKPTETVRASNVPVRYDEATGAERNVGSGDVGYTATHRLTFGASAETMAVTPKYLVKVLARGDKPIMFFEQPVRTKGSMAVFVKCLAKQTTGFREPANV